MNHKITLIIVFILTLHITCKATQLTLYNSLPCTLYYAIQTTTHNEHTFCTIEPYGTIETELENAHGIALSIVKELPQAGHEIPLHMITISSPRTLIALKTYQTTKGEIRLVTQPPITSKQPLDTPCIDHRDILLSKTTYKPTPIVEEPIKIESSQPASTQEEAITATVPAPEETQENLYVEPSIQSCMALEPSTSEATSCSSAIIKEAGPDNPDITQSIFTITHSSQETN